MLQQMHPGKAPRPDGMNLSCFQKYWQIVGEDVIQAVPNVLNKETSPSSFNHMHVGEFRLISLCNVVSKLITKAIANRLKVWLPSNITANQSAFVPGHQLQTIFLWRLKYSMI